MKELNLNDFVSKNNNLRKSLKELSREELRTLFDFYIPNLEIFIHENGCEFTSNSFKIFRVDDNFYIIHLYTLTVINFYKHLTRDFTCNTDITLENFIFLLIELDNEIKESEQNA